MTKLRIYVSALCALNSTTIPFCAQRVMLLEEFSWSSSHSSSTPRTRLVLGRAACGVASHAFAGVRVINLPDNLSGDCLSQDLLQCVGIANRKGVDSRSSLSLHRAHCVFAMLCHQRCVRDTSYGLLPSADLAGMKLVEHAPIDGLISFLRLVSGQKHVESKDPRSYDVVDFGNFCIWKERSQNATNTEE